MPNANFVICPGLHPAFVPSLSVALYPPTLPTLTTTCDNIDHSEPVGVIATMTTNAYSEIYAVNCTPHNTARGFFPVPGDEWAPPARAGPWGWQWRNDMHEIVSIPSSSVPISIKALFDSIEKVGAVERTCVSRIADGEHLDCAWDVQNRHGFGLLKIARVPFHRQRTGHGEFPQPTR